MEEINIHLDQVYSIKIFSLCVDYLLVFCLFLMKEFEEIINVDSVVINIVWGFTLCLVSEGEPASGFFCCGGNKISHLLICISLVYLVLVFT